MSEEFAVVSFERRNWSLAEGELLPYGREPDRPLRIDDKRVSARAGILFVRHGWAWIRHDSRSHPITVVPPAGKERTIRPVQAGPANPEPLPAPKVRLEMWGSYRTISIDIDSSRLSGPASGPDLGANPELVLDRTETVRGFLDPNDLQLLAALDEQLLLSGGLGRPARTKDVARRLGLAAKTAEHRLTKLRQLLTEFGINGLIRDPLISPGTSSQAENYVDTLGFLAYESGWVLPADLELLSTQPVNGGAGVGSP